MKKTVLVICDKIQEINRLRRYFDSTYTIKATNSANNAVGIAESSEIGLILYEMGRDYTNLFKFYKDLRTNEKTKELPIIAITDFSVLKTLNDTVKMLNTVIIGSTITTENMQNLIATYFPEDNKDEFVEDVFSW